MLAIHVVSGTALGVVVRRLRVPRVLLGAMVGLLMLSGVVTVQPSPAMAAAGAGAPIAALPVPLFRQTDAKWSGFPIGIGCKIYTQVVDGKTVTFDNMNHDGCAVTSIAMVYAYAGLALTDANVKGMDPGIVAHAVSGCLTNWKSRGFAAISTEAAVRAELNAGRPVIAHVRRTSNPSVADHYVVITGSNGSNWIINNPDPYPPFQSITAYDVIVGYYKFTLAGYTNSITMDESTPAFSGSVARVTTVGYAAGTDWATTVAGPAATVAGVWSTTIPATGTWQLSVWVPRNYSTTTNAVYNVGTPTIQRAIPLSQLAYSDAWVPLGSFALTVGDYPTVLLSNATGRPGEQIAFDALKWTKVA